MALPGSCVDGPDGSDARLKAPTARLRGGWFEYRDADCYVLARRWPPRLDICAEARFPRVARGRLARQVRQDLWRALQDLRGFAPVIDIRTCGGGLRLLAGGQLACGRGGAGAGDRVAMVLNDANNRRRWLAWSGRGAA
ncbi:hypothetical protein VK792_03625 [Mesobacterium sp. TK19101]|uniref:Uncharacterized protein n=1 Tax=Mesobacterium hydrothermale TaxID=3111907 RepID=A0ABU6HD26_9RHOB|nr:hypothetical protein [Mesobacterium sp. TK19101]MEC3860362.1 hypothetical protein [Mesobacterium sp. TK19101]